MSKTNTNKKTIELLTDLYDAIMVDIEPDLCSYMIDGLDDLYKGETKAENKVRLDRYVEAFELFENVYTYITSSWGEHFAEVRNTVIEDAKKLSKTKDTTELLDIEEEIAQEDSPSV